VRELASRPSACALAARIGTACLLALPAFAGEADVVAATAHCDAKSICRFAVTLRHADTGWDHYADRWEVLTSEGALLATRVLRHPHVDEQPFTRRLKGVALPKGIGRVRIRAGDSVHGLGGAELVVDLQREGASARPLRAE
jgi:hypothetical protein